MLVTPPVLEPLTLDEAKLRAGLDWAPGDARDALLTGFIQVARSQVERDTGVALLTQTHSTLIIAREALTARPVLLPCRPVQSVIVDAVVGGAVWDAAQYALDASSVDPAPARLTLATATYWPEGLRATIVAGFVTVAELAAHAPGLLHAVGLLVGHYATVGRDLTAVGTSINLVPHGYQEAIAPYQLVTLA